MGRRGIVLAFIFFVSAASSSFAETVCEAVTRLLAERQQSAPKWVTIPNGQRFFVHNHEVAEMMAGGYSPDFMQKFYSRLSEEGALHLPVNRQGVLVASSRLGYAKKFWDRDHIMGFLAAMARGDQLMASKMLSATLNRYGTGAQRTRIYRSLLHPHAHMYDGPDGLPQVIGDPESLEDAHPWSPQKDAYGLVLHAAMDGFDHKLAAVENMTDEAKAGLIGMFALMVQIKFWDLHTVDAWEEAYATYSSGIGLVTGALERLEAARSTGGAPSQGIWRLIDEIDHNRALSEVDRTTIRTALEPTRLRGAIDEGYKKLFQQLKAGGEAPNLICPHTKREGRTADMALLLLFVHRLNRFSEADYRNVLELAEKLVRPSGMIRYRDPAPDGYLHPAYFAENSDRIPGDLLRTEGVEVFGGNLREAFTTRYPKYIEEAFGKRFEAQWSLGVINLILGYRSMLKWFPDPNGRLRTLEFDREQKELNTLRMAALATGGPGRAGANSTQQPEVALDGTSVAGFQFAEAHIPWRIYQGLGNGRRVVSRGSVTSPYWPLYWAAALAEIALQPGE